MLETLSIRHLGLISEAELSLGSGLVVITGETGAGKTLLLHAIQALAGAKPPMAGSGGDTTIDGWLQATGVIATVCESVGAQVEDGGVTITRIFPADGRAKALLGGRPVPANLLAELAGEWLAVHGQHDTLRLLKPSTHLDLLDRHGDTAHANALSEYRGKFADWRRLADQLAAASRERAELLAVAEALRADVALCESLALQPGEDAEIAAKIDRLSRTEQIRQAVSTALELLDSDDGGAAQRLRDAARSLDHAISGDSLVDDLVQRLRNAQSELADVSHELVRLVDGLEIEPAALDALMLRQRQIRTLLLRHGPTMGDLLDWLDSARRKLALLDPDGGALAELQAAERAARTAADAFAGRLSEARRATGKRLAAEVAAELQELAMPFAQFDVSFEPVSLSENGGERVEFQFSANPGLPLTAIQQAASGGELSRLMLAIEVALIGDRQSGGEVLVFDEVDAGVAGAAALAVGERLARLARAHQVLVVSHLAQIAAFADQHIKVSKDSDGLVSNTSIQQVPPAERVVEIARMLGGVEDSAAAQAHALELLTLSGRI